MISILLELRFRNFKLVKYEKIEVSLWRVDSLFNDRINISSLSRLEKEFGSAANSNNSNCLIHSSPRKLALLCCIKL